MVEKSFLYKFSLKLNFFLLLPFIIVPFLFFTIVFFQFTIDDSYITFRYAKNLVNHGIWNWNNNEELVEAYTSFVYAVLAIMPEYLGLSTPIFFKVAGLLLIVVLLLRIKSSFSHISFIAALCLCVLDWKVYAHLYSGLETFLFIYLLFELNLILLAIIKKENYNEGVLWLLCLLLPLTRPEGILFSIFSFIILLFYQKEIKKKVILLVVLAIGCSYFFLRFSYFGALLPNAVYFKGVSESNYKLIFGNLYSSLSYLAILFILSVLIKDKAFRIISCTAFLVFIIAYSHSSLMMNYADRFPFQLFLPVILLSSKFIDRTTIKSIFLVYSFIFLLSYSKSLNEIKTIMEYGPRIANSYRQLASVLEKNESPHQKLLLVDVGIIPYYSNLISYDAVGLADKHVAREGLSYNFISNVSPDYIVLNSTTSDENGVFKSNGQDIIYSYITNNNFVRMPSLKFSDESYLLLYCRQGTDNLKRIEEEMGELNNTQQEISVLSILRQRYLKSL